MLPYIEYVNSKKYWIAKLLYDATTQPFFNIFYLDNDHHEMVLIYGIRHYEQNDYLRDITLMNYMITLK